MTKLFIIQASEQNLEPCTCVLWVNKHCILQSLQSVQWPRGGALFLMLFSLIHNVRFHGLLHYLSLTFLALPCCWINHA